MNEQELLKQSLDDINASRRHTFSTNAKSKMLAILDKQAMLNKLMQEIDTLKKELKEMKLETIDSKEVL